MVGHAATKWVFVSMNAAVETKVKERDGLGALEKTEIGIVAILRCMNLHTASITEDENLLLRQNWLNVYKLSGKGVKKELQGYWYIFQK